MALEYDEAVCSEPDCLHNAPPNRAEVLYAESANVAPGLLSLEYASGLDDENLEAFRSQGNRVSQITLRLDCIEPQTGMRVQQTFVMSTSMAHHLGAEMIGAAWHHSSSVDDFWAPTKAEPDQDGVRLAVAFYQTIGEDGHGDNDGG